MKFNLFVPRQYRRYFAIFYAFPDSDPTAMLHAPWARLLRCHSVLGVPAATLRRVSCDAMAFCFRGDITLLVLSMFKIWQQPRQPWRRYCHLQCCHSALRDLTTTQWQSAATWLILQIAASWWSPGKPYVSSSWQPKYITRFKERNMGAGGLTFSLYINHIITIITVMCIWTRTKVARRKHIQPTGFSAYSSTCF